MTLEIKWWVLHNHVSFWGIIFNLNCCQTLQVFCWGCEEKRSNSSSSSSSSSSSPSPTVFLSFFFHLFVESRNFQPSTPLGIFLGRPRPLSRHVAERSALRCGLCSLRLAVYLETALRRVEEDEWMRGLRLRHGLVMSR